jgi:hypothetical protein
MLGNVGDQQTALDDEDYRAFEEAVIADYDARIAVVASRSHRRCGELVNEGEKRALLHPRKRLHIPAKPRWWAGLRLAPDEGFHSLGQDAPPIRSLSVEFGDRTFPIATSIST